MNKELLLISSRLAPGPAQVIKNLQGIMNDKVCIRWLPLEDILVPKIRIKNKKTNYRYMRMQEYLQIFNLNRLLKYGDNIIFVAWGNLYNILIHKLNKKGITPSLIMCSTIGQSDFENIHRMHFMEVIDNVQKGNIRWFLLNKRLYNSLGKCLPRSVYFPHTINMNQFADIKPKALTGINIDIFCSVRYGKNVMNQIYAYKHSQTAGTLHINFSNLLIDQWIECLELNVIKHRWLDESEYYRLIAAMHLSLQVSFTESFCYAVCERMALSVPTLTSYDIYLTAEDPFLAKHLCVQALDSPWEIGGSIKKIVDDPKLRKELAEGCKKRIQQIARENNKIVQDFITSNF